VDEFVVFRAVSFEEDDELDLLTVAFAANSDGSGESLIFQAQLGEFDDQDVSLAQDRYCVMTGDGAVGYGGVVSLSVDDADLRFEFSVEASENLGVDSEIHCLLDVPEDLRKQVVASLVRILEIAPIGERSMISISD
jgi:hypothetical protein